MQLPRAAPALSSFTQTVQCRLFARYAELFASGTVAVRVASPATVADVVQALRSHRPGGDSLPERPLVAVNHEHAMMNRAVLPGDDVALLPPLAGG